jgi:hypothetical protein
MNRVTCQDKFPTDKLSDNKFSEKNFPRNFPIRVFCALKFLDRAGSCSYMPKVAPDVLDCPCKGERARRARALGHDPPARQSQLLLHQSGLGLHRYFDRAAAAVRFCPRGPRSRSAWANAPELTRHIDNSVSAFATLRTAGKSFRRRPAWSSFAPALGVE